MFRYGVEEGTQIVHNISISYGIVEDFEATVTMSAYIVDQKLFLKQYKSFSGPQEQ